MESDYKKKIICSHEGKTHTHTTSLSQAPVSGSVDWGAQMTCNLITEVICLGKKKKKKIFHIKQPVRLITNYM